MKLFILLFLTLSLSAKAETRRNYQGVKQMIEKIATQNTANSSIFYLPESDSRQKPIGLKVGNGKTKNLVVAAHHGNEYGSTEVALAFAESVAKDPIPDQTLYIIPVLNINGYNTRQRNEVDAKGIARDPNRDYPGPCGTDGPFHLKSTKALADFVAAEGIVNSATLHTHFPAVVYPWGLSSHDLATPYPDVFRQMVNHATMESRYQTGNSTEVIYPADGTFEDFAYWKHGVWSILFELGFSHSPSENAIKTMIEVNLPGMRRMFAAAPTEKAKDHNFTGKCDLRLRSLDRRDE